MAQWNPFTTIWVTFGMERMGGTTLPFMFFLEVGSLRPLVASSSSPGVGSGVLFPVVLLWGKPKTLPGWHMLVGEERTKG